MNVFRSRSSPGTSEPSACECSSNERRYSRDAPGFRHAMREQRDERTAARIKAMSPAGKDALKRARRSNAQRVKGGPPVAHV